MTRLICILCLFCSLAYGQTGYIASYKLPSIDQFYVDQFQNIYVVKGPELRKYDPTYKQLYSFSNPIKGNISQADVLNALNPYIFYKDWNEVVVVDNRLNASTAINFNDYGFLDVQFISFSDQYNVWFYDQATDKLYKFNLPSKKVSNTSLNITQLVGKENEPKNMISTINMVYLNVPDKGILVFDALGALQKTIPVKGVESVQVQGQQLYFLKDQHIHLYDLQTAQTSQLELELKEIKSFQLSGKKIYLQTKSGIEVYTFPVSKSGK